MLVRPPETYLCPSCKKSVIVGNSEICPICGTEFDADAIETYFSKRKGYNKRNLLTAIIVVPVVMYLLFLLFSLAY